MRWLSIALAIFHGILLSQCRHNPPERGPAPIIPLVPDAVVPASAARVIPPSRPPMRWQNYVLAPRQPVANAAEMVSALERRAEALDAVSPHAEVRPDGKFSLRFAMQSDAWRVIVREQLVRTGMLEFFLVDIGCNAFEQIEMSLPNNFFLYINKPMTMERYLVELWMMPSGNDMTPPLEPFLRQINRLSLRPNRRVLTGLTRFPDMRPRQNARRAICVRTDIVLRNPRFTEIEPTIDEATLDPALQLRFETPYDQAFDQFLQQAPGGLFIAAIDGEIMAVVGTGDAYRRGRLQLLPTTRAGLVSPELVSALLRSGPLPGDLAIESETQGDRVEQGLLPSN